MDTEKRNDFPTTRPEPRYFNRQGIDYVVLLSIVALAAIACFALFTEYSEVAAACAGAIGGIATRLYRS